MLPSTVCVYSSMLGARKAVEWLQCPQKTSGKVVASIVADSVPAKRVNTFLLQCRATPVKAVYVAVLRNHTFSVSTLPSKVAESISLVHGKRKSASTTSAFQDLSGAAFVS